jgi:hypothetical protein
MYNLVVGSLDALRRWNIIGIHKIISSILFFTILSSIYLPSKSIADWASSFVVYDQYIYEISDEYVTEIDEEIGRVTKYSDMEGTYNGNFSNTFKKGTKYYSIKGVGTERAIAVDVNDKYVKAIRQGEYAGQKYSPFSWIIGGAIIFVMLTLLIFIVEKKVPSRNTY